MSIQRLNQLDGEKIIARSSAGFTIASGALAATCTGPLSLGWSAVGWRKGHVVHHKLEMVREELLRQRETLHEPDEKDFALVGVAFALGNVVGGGLVDVGVAE